MTDNNPTPADDPFDRVNNHSDDANNSNPTTETDGEVTTRDTGSPTTNTGPPARFEEIDAEPFPFELTLLQGKEPENPGSVSYEEHAQTLIGLADQELRDSGEKWHRFGITLHVFVRDAIFAKFLGFLKSDKMDYEMYRELGIETIDDALNSDTIQEAFYPTWDAFLDRDVGSPIFRADLFDEWLCKLLGSFDVLDYDYLRNRPTVANPVGPYEDEGERMMELREQMIGGEMWKKYKDCAARHLDRENWLEGQHVLHVERSENSRDRKWTMVPPHQMDVVEELLSLCEERMERDVYQTEMVQAVAHHSFCKVMDDLKKEWLTVGTLEQLGNMGLGGPADILNYEQVVDTYKTMAINMLENQDPIGPYQQWGWTISDVAQSGPAIGLSGVISREEKRRITRDSPPWTEPGLHNLTEEQQEQDQPELEDQNRRDGQTGRDTGNRSGQIPDDL
jgi:hypothetical protein